MQKSKMAVWGGLTNSCEVKRREVISKGEKERYMPGASVRNSTDDKVMQQEL